MIEHKPKVAFSTSGTVETVEATIAMDATLFQMLRDQYENLPKAVVRETLSNVVDAYVMENEDTWETLAASNPPRITTPNYENPNLVIQDFGIGMSKEFVFTVYNAFNSSTKRESKVAIGARGLGAKVTGAYTPQTLLETVFEGVRNFFVLTDNTEGIPCYTWVGAEETTDKSGTKITIPCKSGDFSEFEDSIAEFMVLSPIDFIVDGNLCKKLEMPEISGTYKGLKWWKLASTDDSPGYYSSYDTKTTIAVGPVLYTLSTDSTLAGLSRSFRFQIPVGSVDLTPSRDAIAQTTRTSEALHDFWTGLPASLIADADVLLQEKYKTAWEWVEAMQGESSYLLKYITYQGKTLQEWYHVKMHDLKSTIADDLQIVMYNANLNSVSQQSCNIDCHIRPDCKIYFNDVKSGGISRVKEVLRPDRYSSAAVINCTSAKTPFEQAVFVQAVSEALGSRPILLTSTLPKKEKKTKEAASDYVFTSYTNGVRHTMYEADIPEGSSYVLTERGQLGHKNSSITSLTKRLALSETIVVLPLSYKRLVQKLRLVPAAQTLKPRALEYLHTYDQLWVDTEWRTEFLCNKTPCSLQTLKSANTRAALAALTGHTWAADAPWILQQLTKEAEPNTGALVNYERVKDYLDEHENYIHTPPNTPNKKLMTLWHKIATKLPELELWGAVGSYSLSITRPVVDYLFRRLNEKDNSL